MTTKRAPFTYGATSFGIMRDVLIALVPVSGMAVVQFRLACDPLYRIGNRFGGFV